MKGSSLSYNNLHSFYEFEKNGKMYGLKRQTKLVLTIKYINHTRTINLIGLNLFTINHKK